MFRWLATTLVLTLLAACSSPFAEKKASPPLLDPSVLGKPFRGPFPLVVTFPDTMYYLTSPQQARPPDGFFEKDTRVALVLDAGSHSLVTSESGITAYVSAEALRLIK
jgi:hypothetical protein